MRITNDKLFKYDCVCGRIQRETLSVEKWRIFKLKKNERQSRKHSRSRTNDYGVFLSGTVAASVKNEIYSTASDRWLSVVPIPIFHEYLRYYDNVI